MYICCHWTKGFINKNVVRALEENGAMEFTIVVAAAASESAAMQYLSLTQDVPWVNFQR